jgi:hypothetical protein
MAKRRIAACPLKARITQRFASSSYWRLHDRLTSECKSANMCIVNVVSLGIP